MIQNYNRIFKWLWIGGLVISGMTVFWQSTKAVSSCVNYIGPKESVCRLNVIATDPENDKIYYTFNWGDNTSTRIPESGYVNSNTNQYADHTWMNGCPNSLCTIYVTATDEGGNVSLTRLEVVVNIFAGHLPNIPYSPDPTHNGIAPLDGELDTGVTLSWRGGDPLDSDTITPPIGANSVSYEIWLEDAGDPLVKIATLSNQTYTDTVPVIHIINNTDVNVVLTGGSFKRGNNYHWKIKVTDADGNKVEGPEWSFKVNRLPTIGQPTVTPDEPPYVNTYAKVNWTASDLDLQPLVFSVRYQNNVWPMNPVNCNGDYSSCEGTWTTCGLETSANQTIKVIADDGKESIESVLSIPFEISHTITHAYPADFTAVINDQTIDLAIGDGSLGDNPNIKFKGACWNMPSRNPSVMVNNSGSPISWTGDLGANEEATIIMNGLTTGSTNSLRFSLDQGANLCNSVKYQVTYNLTTSCSEPFIRTTWGSIYSQGDIKTSFITNTYNAKYLVAAGGEIANFRSSQSIQTNYVRQGFSKLKLPSVSSGITPTRAAFDFWGLTHKTNGDPAADGESNIYGHEVRIFNQNGAMPISLSNTLQNNNPLQGRVYFYNGNTKVDGPIIFNNGRADEKGAGIIIIKGDLEIKSDIKYIPDPLTDLKVSQLASVGWMVLGNVNVNSVVNTIAGAFFVTDNPNTNNVVEGIFNTGIASSPFTSIGPIIARKIEFVRTTSNPKVPSELIVNDGRIFLNTPPGFSDVIKTLPTWQLRAP